MQKVSQEWIDNQNGLLTSESFVEVVMTLTDPDAYADASATDNGAIYISNTAQIVSEVDKDIVPYATLERNMWLLDGSRKIIPTSDFGDCGFISEEIANLRGVFNNPPIVTVNFSKTHNNLIPGVTITWSNAYDDYAMDFTVTAYKGDTVVATKNVTDNRNVKSIVEMDIAEYDKITIEILRWCLSFRRARISEILPGVEKTYGKNELFSFEHSQDVDLFSASLPKSQISFSIDNTDNSYNPNNLDSMAKYLIERQEIKARYGYKIGEKIEWIDCGTFYMSEWDAPQGGMTADFSARDLLEFMTGTYYKGMYSPDGTSLYDLAVAVLQDANLPLEDDGATKWVISNMLKVFKTTVPLPIDTHANCLQLIANAGRSVIYQDRKGVLHIEPYLEVDSEYSINHFNSYSKSDLSLSKPLKQVDVPCYSYSVSDSILELYKGRVSVNGTQDVLITYSNSAVNVTASISGGKLNSASYYTNACVLNITATGSVDIVVTGNELSSSTATVTVTNGEKGEDIVVDNPLITDYDRASIVGSLVKSYMKKRMVLSSNWRADPRLDVLDVVDNENDYNTNKVLITNVKYSYNGAFKGTCDGRVI